VPTKIINAQNNRPTKRSISNAYKNCSSSCNNIKIFPDLYQFLKLKNGSI
jgi:hypothetical protein